MSKTIRSKFYWWHCLWKEFLLCFLRLSLIFRWNNSLWKKAAFVSSMKCKEYKYVTSLAYLSISSSVTTYMYSSTSFGSYLLDWVAKKCSATMHPLKPGSKSSSPSSSLKLCVVFFAFFFFLSSFVFPDAFPFDWVIWSHDNKIS